MALNYVTGHKVFIYDRGGIDRFGELVQLSLVRWHRVRDDISEGEIAMNGSIGSLQAAFLASIEPGRHEMVVFRGDERVWEGPITRIAYSRSTVKIFARDVLHYGTRTIMKAGYSSAYPNTEYGTARIKRIMVAEFARQEALTPPINVTPFIVEHHYDTNAKTSLVTPPYKYLVWEHLDNMASKSGIDYTVVGRAIHLWDTSRPIGMTAVVTENDFMGDVTVTAYGMELATFNAVTDGEGGFSTAGGADPYYGLIETLDTMDNEDEHGHELATPELTAAERTAQAQRNLEARNPAPVRVHVPDGSSLNPVGVLSVSDLVPGVYIPVLATVTARTVSQMQKLTSVTVEETSDGELITIVMLPATTPDEVAA